MTAEYIAGFFDGEGHVTIRRSNGYKVKSGLRKSPSYTVCVGFTNTKLPILEALQAFLGGKIYQKKIRNKNAAQGWELFLGRKDEVDNFLAVVGPSVILKAGQVALARQFRSLPKVRLDYVGRGKTWPLIQSNEEDIFTRESFKMQMAELNKRGISCQQKA